MRKLGALFSVAVGLAVGACGGEVGDGVSTGVVEQAAESCNCPAVIDPVCGVDGKTYDNSCVAECAGMKVEHDGPCKPSVGMNAADKEDPKTCDAICPAVIDPVCGSDGEMHDNACVATNCAGVEVVPDACCLSAVPPEKGCDGSDSDTPIGLHSSDEAKRPDKCTTEWDPVCGVDGNTYGNACEAGVAGVDILYHGECDGRPTVCTTEWDPVCGEDGNTYGNACEAGVAGVKVVHEGECSPVVSPGLAGKLDPGAGDGESCNCLQVWEPVCGVDGKTYSNACFARCAGTKVAHEGECRPISIR